MSRLRRPSGEEGFSLVEILVSITIFATVATAVLPLLLAGIRGGTHAKLTTQAKNIGQERLELMRNLPYYVAQQNGDYRDVLDVYYRDLDDPGAIGAGDPCATRRYVAASKSYRCQVPSSSIGGAQFDQVVEATFVNAAGAVVPPRADYDSQVTNLDAPASNLLDIRITTTWSQGAESREFVLRSRIAKSADDAPLITAKVKASAVKLSSTTATGTVVTLEAGLLSGEGSKSTASSANASAVGAYASLDSGTVAKGAEVNLSAPLDDVVNLPPAGAMTLGGSCELACFGDTRIKGAAAAKVSQQVPQIGIDGSVVGLEAELSRSGGIGSRGFDYSNTDLGSANASVGASALPLVSAGAGAAGPVVSSTGSLTATAFGATSVTSKVSSVAQAVQLFPTSTAPDGVVQLRLLSSSLTCVDGAGRAVTADWSAEVRVHTPSGYSAPYVIKPDGTQLPSPASVVTSSGHTLDRYIGSWSGLVGSAGSVAQTSTPGVSAEIPAVLTVLTAPTRLGDPTSVINLTMGSLSCAAEDNQ